MESTRALFGVQLTFHRPNETLSFALRGLVPTQDRRFWPLRCMELDSMCSSLTTGASYWRRWSFQAVALHFHASVHAEVRTLNCLAATSLSQVFYARVIMLNVETNQVVSCLGFSDILDGVETFRHQMSACLIHADPCTTDRHRRSSS